MILNFSESFPSSLLNFCLNKKQKQKKINQKQIGIPREPMLEGYYQSIGKEDRTFLSLADDLPGPVPTQLFLQTLPRKS